MERMFESFAALVTFSVKHFSAGTCYALLDSLSFIPADKDVKICPKSVKINISYISSIFLKNKTCTFII